MKKLIVFFLMFTLVAFISGVMAQPKPAPEKPAAAPSPAPKPAEPEKIKLEKFGGVIEKVDEVAKAIDVKGKIRKEEKTLTFLIDEKTNITKGKEKLSFSDLKKEMHVSVEYKKDGDKMVAVAIKVAAPKAAPKKKEEPKK